MTMTIHSPTLVQSEQRRSKTLWRYRPLLNPPRDIRDKLEVTNVHERDQAYDEGGRHDQAWTAKELNRSWKRHQRHMKKVSVNVVPDRFKEYDAEFDEVVSFQKQLASLEKRGFLRPYKAYEPPQDLDQRFVLVQTVLKGSFTLGDETV